MKMSKERYKELKIIAKANISQISLGEYRKAGLSDSRYLWDLLWIDGATAVTWTVEAFGDGLNDDHIETGLRNAVLDENSRKS